MSDWLPPVLLIAGGLSIPFGLWALISGAEASVYPEYSSQRTDERGVSVFYESLSNTGRLELSRNFQPLSRLHSNGTGILVIGVRLNGDAEAMDRLLIECEALAKTGDRVAVTLEPDISNSSRPSEMSWYAFEKRDLHLVWNSKKPLRARDQFHWVAGFQPGSSWRVLREKNQHAEAIERPVGEGVLVLVSNSDEFTNANMVKQRDTILLLTLLGRQRKIAFDESHLGIVETGSVLGLARHYRLQGFLGSTLVLCILFLWRSASAFPPRRDRAPYAAQIRDPLSGLATLLERSLPKRDLIAQCLRARAQADRSGANTRRLNDWMREEADGQEPLVMYRHLQDSLHSKRKITQTR